jgi:ribosomal protein S18 acetylase RimI-like enzyme
MSIHIRDAIPGDEGHLARVMLASNRWAHRRHLPRAYVYSLTREESARNWLRTLRRIERAAMPVECVLFAKDERGRPVGEAMGGPDQLEAGVGAVHNLCVLPAYQGRGIGRLLVGAVAQRMAEYGLHGLRIRVLRVNTAARGFYERLGGRLVGEVAHEDEGVLIDLVIYGWDDTSSLSSPGSDPS